MLSAAEELAAMPRFCTLSEAAAFLGVTRETVRRYAEAGDLDLWRTEAGRARVSRDSMARLVGIDLSAVPVPPALGSPK